jgi:hypothetical protein
VTTRGTPVGRRRSRRLAVVAAVAAVVSGAVAYTANVWLLARRYDGLDKIPRGAPVSAGPQHLQGMVFWFLAGATASAAAIYLVVVGPRAAARRALALPRRLWGLLTGAGDRWQVWALYGAGVALLVGAVLLPALRGLIGLGVLLFLPSAAGRAISRGLARVVSAVAGARVVEPVPRIETAMVGAAGGFVVGYAVPSTPARLVVAALVLAGAVFQSRRSTGGALAIVVAGLVILQVAWAARAGADEGGWTECGETWDSWRGCDGSDRVLDAAVGAGVAGAVGGAAGALLAAAALVSQPVDEKDGGNTPQVRIVTRTPVASEIEITPRSGDDAPTWVVRIEPHGDRGTQVLEEVDR